ncbi:MAG: T9SS type A sorting domain-containing protein [Ignavibacteriae bacterium]|nr:T9SS type A sorting domain-containing protein [Ignavibacteriota bacterium]
MNRKLKSIIYILFATVNLFAQSGWNEVWNLQQVPFQQENAVSEYAKVIAGFDTDNDGFGEFITGYTDFIDSNYIFMYEATGDNSYEMVWYFKFPYECDSWFGAAVGDLDNDGISEIVLGLPTKTTILSNPPRIFVFEWNEVQGENKYGKEQTDGSFLPSSTTRFDVEDNMEWFPYSMKIEDVDKDNKNELVLGIRSGSRGREVLIASVSGDFSFFPIWNVEYNFKNEEGGSNFATVTGDLDNDGQTDIVEVVWNFFTLRFFESTGANTYEHVNDLEQLYLDQGIDYGSVDAAIIVDANNDGKNELFIAGADDAGIDRHIFLIQNISDISTITAKDVVEFYYVPKNKRPNDVPLESGLRNMVVGDPDNDGNLNFLICGAESGQIYDLEYSGEGDLADSSNWNLTVIYDSFIEAQKELSADSAAQLSPRHYYGSLADDMDGDGLSEYVFCNYSTDKHIWPNDIYISILEADRATDVKLTNSILPEVINLDQNYPNPFNPSIIIRYSLPTSGMTKIYLYDILGREIMILVDEFKSVGNYEIKVNAEYLSNGIYFYRIISGHYSETKKMIVVK